MRNSKAIFERLCKKHKAGPRLPSQHFIQIEWLKKRSSIRITVIFTVLYLSLTSNMFRS